MAPPLLRVRGSTASASPRGWRHQLQPGQLTNPEALTAGQSYTRTASFTLPNNISGQYLINVTTNVNDSLYESNFGNNTGTSKPFSIALAPYADLAASNVTVPATVTAGQLLHVSWSVANLGTGGTTASAWYDQVYISLSPDGIDNTAIALGSVQNPTYLGVGESYSSSLSVALSTSLPQGTYYAYVDTNSTGSQQEYITSNNVAHSAIGVQVQPISNPALFDVTKVTVSPAVGAYEGQSVLVTYTVTNTGGQPITGTWYDGLALSPTQAYDGAGAESLEVITVSNQSPLLPGASYSESAIVTLPTNLSGNLFVVVDPDHEETASQTGGVGSGDVPKTDGSGAIIVSVPPQPKLDVTTVAAPTSITANSALSVTWQVENDGFAPTGAASWTDGIYLSPTNTLGSSVILLGTQNHAGSLAAGSSYTASGLFTVNYRLSGNYYIFVKTDIGNHVPADDSSSNHTGMQAAAITIAPYVDNGSGSGSGGSTLSPLQI